MDWTRGRVSSFRTSARRLGRAALRGLAAAFGAGAAAVLFVGLKRFLAGPAELPTGVACLGAAAAVVALLAALTSGPVRARLSRRAVGPGAETPDAPPVTMPGSLRGSFDLIPLPILVQALHASWRTGVLAADFGGRPGRIYFERGEVVEARFGPASGVAAFNLMYAEAGGAFCFRPAAAKVKRSVDSRILRLLVNAERSCRDESSVHWAVRPFPPARPHRRTPEHDRERTR